jgi:hypothetical protein
MAVFLGQRATGLLVCQLKANIAAQLLISFHAVRL